MTTPPAALAVRDLRVAFHGRTGPVEAVSDVTFSVGRGEIFGIVGESGCGKSTLVLSILRLLAASATTSGSIEVDGRDVLRASPAEMRSIRGGRIGYVPQDPLVSLDPTFSVGEQIAEAVRAHNPDLRRHAARERAVQLMERVGIRQAAARYANPPHTFSGGMRQRVAIAVAVANHPALVLADEPTTALDVTIQRQVLQLLAGLADDLDTAVCLITHDLGIVADVCDRVAVLYAGRIVEMGPVAQIMADPRHPYTQGLLDAMPSRAATRGKLHTIPGQVLDLARLPGGCAFAPRCAYRIDTCARRPELLPLSGERSCACWRADGAEPGGVQNIEPGPSRGCDD